MVFRIAADILVVLSIFYSPWWVTALIILSSFFIFKNFYEGIFAGFLIDVLYGVKATEFLGIWFVHFAFYFIFYMLSLKLKKNIRMYETV